MIKNATILRITAPNTPGPNGEPSWTPAVGTLGIRCAQTAPTRRQIYQLGAIIKDVTAVVRVLSSELAAQTVDAGYQIQSQIDGRSAETFVVVHVTDTVKAGLSNRAIFLRRP